MKQEEKIKSFIEHCLQNYASYHNAKEIMVHAGFLIEMSLFVALIKTDLASKLTSNILSLVVFTIVWILLHVFIRLQQRLKRGATIRYNGYFVAFNAFCITKLDDLNLDTDNFGRDRNIILLFLDNIIPISCIDIRFDLDNVEIPGFIITHLEEQRQPTQAIYYDWILTILSLIMYIISFLHIY